MAQQIADIVRREWTWAGVEVESTSESKVRCRMPPVFRDVQAFVDTLSHHDLCVDLETTCRGNVASVVLVVYAGDGCFVSSREGVSPPRGCASIGCAFALAQLALVLVFNPWTLRHVANVTSLF